MICYYKSLFDSYTGLDLPAKIFLHQLCVDTGCCLEDWPEVMAERDWSREREIITPCPPEDMMMMITIYIYIYIYIYMYIYIYVLLCILFNIYFKFSILFLQNCTYIFFFINIFSNLHTEFLEIFSFFYKAGLEQEKIARKTDFTWTGMLRLSQHQFLWSVNIRKDSINTFLVFIGALYWCPAFIADFWSLKIISAPAVTPTWVQTYQAGSLILCYMWILFFFSFGRVRTFIANSSQWEEFFFPPSPI